MANPRYTSTHSSTNYGIIQVGQLDTVKAPSAGGLYYLAGTTQEGYPNYQQIPNSIQFDRHTPKSTILNLSTSIAHASAHMINMAPGSIDDALEAGKNIYNSGGGDWDAFIELLQESIGWLWGSLKGGGLGIVRATGYSGSYFIATYGLYTSNISGDERICCNISNSMSASELSNGFICTWYDANNDTSYAYQLYWTCKQSTATRCIDYTGSNIIPDQVIPVGVLYSPIYNGGFENVWTNSTANAGTLFGDVPTKIVLRDDISSPWSNERIICPTSKTLTLSDDYVMTGDFNSDEVETTNPEGGIATTGGGDGNFDNSVSGGDMSNVDSYGVDAINSGFVTIYNPTQANVQAFTDFLFTGITEDVAVVLKRLISNPLDYVISMNMIHFTPNTSGSEEIKFCGISTGVVANRVSKQFQTIDCGSIYIGEQFSTFLDYGGFSKVKIYLPYCGIFPLSTNDVMGGTLHCKYSIDLLTGACIVQLGITRKRSYVTDDPSLNDKVVYEYTGNVFSQVPLSAIDYRGTIQGLMQIAGGVTNVATGSAAGLGSIASGVMNLKPDVQHSGNQSTSFGYMGTQKPFLILERPMQNVPADFGAREGYASNIYCEKLNDLKGYTEIDIESFKTEFFKGTDVERDELIKILSGGFII